MTTAEPLAQYQLDGAALLASRYRASIFDEPGLGKTAQAIRARELVGGGQTLVICPAGARPVWVGQFALWGRDGAKVIRAETVFDLLTWQRGRCDVLIIGYEQAVNWRADLESDFFDVLIIDEAHYMKNPDAARTKAIIGEHNKPGGIALRASYVWCLTGTPAKNDPADIWAPLWLSGEMRLGYFAFQRTYFRQRRTTFSTSNRVRPDKVAELRAIMAKMSYMRTFEDVGEQLPPMRASELPIDGDSSQVVEYLKQYPGLSDAIIASLETGGKLSFDNGIHIATLRAMIAEAKAPVYAKVITDELLNGGVDKLVVMGHHRAALELVNQHLLHHGIHSEMIVGGVPDYQREKIVNSFQSNDDPNGVRVIVGNITAAGTALTLTAACRIDMLESAFTPADNSQAIKRVRRKGQKRMTLVRLVSLADSFDQVVTRIVLRKVETIRETFGRDQLFNELTTALD